jgi:hypothetical protein
LIPNPGEICRHFDVLAIQTFTPVGSDALLLHAKTSRRIFAIGINLLRKTCLKKVQHHLSFLNKEETLSNFDSANIAAKTTTSCDF